MRSQAVYIVALTTPEASSDARGRAPAPRTPLVAILPWGDVFHDFLDRLGVSFEELRDEFTGSWMFGYAAALATAGVRTLVVCPTTRVSAPVRARHAPTGAGLLLLPASPAFGALRARARRTSLDGRRDPSSVAGAVAAHVAPYLGTPVLRLLRLLRRERCDAVVCQEYEDPRFDVCVALCRTLGIPVFGSFQGADYQLSLLERPLRPLTIRASSGLVVGVRDEQKRLQRRYGVPAAKLGRIFNPVDPEVWYPEGREVARASLGVPTSAAVVAWHGQVQTWRKGLDVLLAAWASLAPARSRSDARLFLVGSGEDADEVRARIAELGDPGVVLVDEWVRDRDRLRTILSAADVYAFPSRHEGLPVAPLEAMACGLPVVGAAASGVADVVGDTGLVVPTGDAEALAAGLGSLLGDDERRLQLGRLARERVQDHFSLESVGARLRGFLVGDGR